MEIDLGPEAEQFRAELRAWIACATSSLPEPLSPDISTVASVGATLSTRSRIACMAAEPPTIQFAMSFMRISSKSSADDRIESLRYL